MKMLSRLLAVALAIFVQADIGHAQTANGKATTAAPTYTANSAAPLSLDLSGNLRMNCVTGCSGAGNSNAQATTAAPSYTNATSNPISQDLSGNLRTTLTTALPAGAATIGNVGLNAGSNIVGNFRIDQTTPGTTNGTVPAGNVASGATDSGNPVKVGSVFNTSAPTFTTGQRADLQSNSNGSLKVVLMGGGTASITTTSPADGFSNASNSIGVFSFGALYNGSTWDRQRGDSGVGAAYVSPAPNSGTSNFSAILANSTNSTNVKASAGVLTEISVYNSSATLAWLKIYNSASAPTCGSGTPVARYLIPAVTSGGAGSNLPISLGKTFSTGISFCVTGLLADADTTATATGTMVVNFTFK